jgi:hypothetical protein
MGFTFITLPGRFEQSDIDSLIRNFDTTEGKMISDGRRNVIKLFRLNDGPINIKYYKFLYFSNRIIYRYFRKSKAQRSFEYAQILLKKGIGTPEPIAFYEHYSFISLGRSYYVSEHLYNDFTFRELLTTPELPDHETILRQFTYFCFVLHENGIEFLDHSPGNTLIKKTGEGNFRFYLVDINRMRFHKSMGFEQRMKNLKRLSTNKEIIEVMSHEYAKWYDKPEEVVFNILWQQASTFAKRHARRKRITNNLKAYGRYLSTFFSNSSRVSA